jgi:predicted membrane-bound spermidine synthase
MFKKIKFEVAEAPGFVSTREGKEERKYMNEGCNFCKPNPYGHGEAITYLIQQAFNDKAHIHTFILGDGLHTVAYPSPEDTQLAKRYSKCVIIKFCPMCGKEL